MPLFWTLEERRRFGITKKFVSFSMVDGSIDKLLSTKFVSNYRRDWGEM